jgi:hypothetical protein
MKFNSFTVSFIRISLCILFLSTPLVAQTDKEVINKIDSLKLDIKNLIGQVNGITKELEKSKKASPTSEKASIEISKQKALTKKFQDSTISLNKSLVSARVELDKMNFIVKENESAKKDIAKLKEDVTAANTAANKQADAAALNARNEEKKLARNNNEALAKRLIESSAIIEASAIDLIAGELDAANPLKAKLSILKQQSQTLQNALVFLDEGKSKFADVYEALTKADFDQNTYPAQHALQQNIKNRYRFFLKAASIINNNLGSVPELNAKIRALKLDNLRYAPESILPIYLELYPYLMNKWEANRDKIVSLEIDAKYLVAE